MGDDFMRFQGDQEFAGILGRQVVGWERGAYVGILRIFVCCLICSNLVWIHFRGSDSELGMRDMYKWSSKGWLNCG